MRRDLKRFCVLLAVVGCVSGLLTCAGSALAVTSAARDELTTYGYSNARLGSSPGPGIAAGAMSKLKIAWVRTLGGGIDDQPLVVSGVKVGRRVRDLVIVGTGHGTIAAIELPSGKVLWRRRVAERRLDAGRQASPDALFGVTSTMVLDKTAGRVYAVDADNRVWALALTTGRVLKGWPVGVAGPANFIWGALALSRGRLYVPTASLCDDTHYFGGIRAIDVANPRHQLKWFTTGGTNTYGGGIWGWGGLSIDDSDGDVFGASGNALPLSNESAGDGERVIRLSPQLKVLQSNYPLQPPFQISDRDFGTVPVLINVRGCGEKAVAINKDGLMYIYDADDIAAGPRRSIRVAMSTNKTIPLYGMPAFDPVTRRLVLTSPSSVPSNGQRVGVQSFVLSPHCVFFPSWQRPFDPPSAGGPPTIAGGVMYIGSGRNGVIRAFRLSDGHQLFARGLGSTIFAAPSVAENTLLVGDWNGRLWAFRPPGR